MSSEIGRENLAVKKMNCAQPVLQAFCGIRAGQRPGLQSALAFGEEQDRADVRSRHRGLHGVGLIRAIPTGSRSGIDKLVAEFNDKFTALDPITTAGDLPIRHPHPKVHCGKGERLNHRLPRAGPRCSRDTGGDGVISSRRKAARD